MAGRDVDFLAAIRRLERELEELQASANGRFGMVPHMSADPSPMRDGMVWIRSDLGKLSFRVAGVTTRLP